MEEIIIFGASGHAKVIFDIISKAGIYKVVAFVSSNAEMTEFLGIKHLPETPEIAQTFSKGIVAIGDNWIRSKVVNKVLKSNPNFSFVKAIHPSASVGNNVIIDDGTVVMAGAVVNPSSRIGKHVIINSASVVDHDCSIGDFASIAPGCILGGNITIGEFSAISLGANIIHSKKIGSHTVIGAGSLVVSDHEDYCVAYGSPCKKVRERTAGEKYL